jgi:hypothetical protein
MAWDGVQVAAMTGCIELAFLHCGICVQLIILRYSQDSCREFRKEREMKFYMHSLYSPTTKQSIYCTPHFLLNSSFLLSKSSILALSFFAFSSAFLSSSSLLSTACLLSSRSICSGLRIAISFGL